MAGYARRGLTTRLRAFIDRGFFIEFISIGGTMARGRGRPTGLSHWVHNLGERIGVELGQVIAKSVQRTLETSIDLGALARRLGANGGRAATGRASCNEAGCGRPVLAKGLCRSHYYRARYRAQKAGTLSPRSRKRRSRRPAQEPQGPQPQAS
jgi:hypothetical protein